MRNFSATLFMTRFVPTRAPHRLWPLSTLIILGLAVPGARGQHGDVFNNIGSTTSSSPGYENRGGTLLRITVLGETARTKLDRQSLVKVSNTTSHVITWQTTDERSEVGFGDLPLGHYEVE